MSLTFPHITNHLPSRYIVHIGKITQLVRVKSPERLLLVFNWVLLAVPFWAVDMAGFLLDTLWRDNGYDIQFYNKLKPHFWLAFQPVLVCYFSFISGGMEFYIKHSV